MDENRNGVRHLGDEGLEQAVGGYSVEDKIYNFTAGDAFIRYDTHELICVTKTYTNVNSACQIDCICYNGINKRWMSPEERTLTACSFNRYEYNGCYTDPTVIPLPW